MSPVCDEQVAKVARLDEMSPLEAAEVARTRFVHAQREYKELMGKVTGAPVEYLQGVSLLQDTSENLGVIVKSVLVDLRGAQATNKTLNEEVESMRIELEAQLDAQRYLKKVAAKLAQKNGMLEMGLAQLKHVVEQLKHDKAEAVAVAVGDECVECSTYAGHNTTSTARLETWRNIDCCICGVFTTQTNQILTGCCGDAFHMDCLVTHMFGNGSTTGPKFACAKCNTAQSVFKPGSAANKLLVRYCLWFDQGCRGINPLDTAFDLDARHAVHADLEVEDEFEDPRGFDSIPALAPAPARAAHREAARTAAQVWAEAIATTAAQHTPPPQRRMRVVDLVSTTPSEPSEDSDEHDDDDEDYAPPRPQRAQARRLHT